ncbi:MAG: D-alanyl-D-alanine carboxypeptidase [Deltaproteobacteria bacterium]|nr:D-alanyl-D-alanine carboxypeptidase [Deltaproteobacteria bacterium]
MPSALFHSKEGGQLLEDKRHRAFLLVIIPLLVFLFPFSAWPNFPEKRLTARAAFLMNADTGEVLYQRKPNLRLPPASATKVATAIVALENGKLHDHLRASKRVAQVPSLRIGLRPGQSMSIQDLLYSALLYSANDASVVLAEGIAGSVAEFAEMMTSKAKQLGAKNTHFTNPHGLTAPGHYSSAKDMVLIFNYAIKNPDFRTIVHTKRKTVRLFTASKNKRVRRIHLRNKNRLLWNFSGAIGGKTGYTRAAKRCFVGAVTRNGLTLVVSVLGSRALWTDTKRLLNYGFHKQIQNVKSSNGFIVQVVSLLGQDRAESLRKRIEQSGYQAYIEKASPINNQTTYRVRIGPYPEWIRAQKAARELESRNGLKAIVLFASSTVKTASANGTYSNR